MGNFHDVYLFEPENFMNAIMPYMEALRKVKNGYSLVRTAAIDLYDRNPQVRFLAEEYGGWDRNAIITQIPSSYPQSPDNIAFWFVILLYGYCRMKEPSTLGLGNHWRLVDSILKMLDWSDADRNLLIEGKRFTELVQKTFLENKKNGEINIMGYWDYVNPFSQDGHVGWISFQESQILLERMINDKDRLTGIAKIMKTDFELLQRVYQAASEMLIAAKEAHCGLCIIRSG
jgi:hypothetical protein